MIHDKSLLFWGSIREMCLVCQAKFNLMMLWFFILFLLFPLATAEISIVSVMPDSRHRRDSPLFGR